MTRYVIRPDVALRLVEDGVAVRAEHQLLAPTLIRSQLLSQLYQRVQGGELTRAEAGERLDAVRGLRLRLLGDRVLQNVAWKLADELGWPDTLDAEYLALTRLQADALVTSDDRFREAVRGVVQVASVDALR